MNSSSPPPPPPTLALALAISVLLLLALAGCATVKQKDREFLADPVMQRIQDEQESALESHTLPLREGSAGGRSGSGGGCGC